MVAALDDSQWSGYKKQMYVAYLELVLVTKQNTAQNKIDLLMALYCV